MLNSAYTHCGEFGRSVEGATEDGDKMSCGINNTESSVEPVGENNIVAERVRRKLVFLWGGKYTIRKNMQCLILAASLG